MSALPRFLAAVLIAASAFFLILLVVELTVYIFALEFIFSRSPSWFLPFLATAIGAFGGVFLGAFALRPNERIRGSAVLLVFGLALPLTIYCFSHVASTFPRGAMPFPRGVLSCVVGG